MTPSCVHRPLSLGDLIGQPIAAVRERLGPPAADRRLARERWLVYDFPGTHIRIRCSPGPGREADPERVSSWTATFVGGGPCPTEVGDRLGLSLHDELEPAPEDSLFLRCALSDPASGTLHSLTARVREGRLVNLTAFDEPPEWLDAPTPDER